MFIGFLCFRAWNFGFSRRLGMQSLDMLLCLGND